MVDSNQMIDVNSIIIFHQNICGLRKKTDELTSSVYPNFPHILCFSEHHLKQFELDQINVDVYKLGAKYCRQFIKKGGVCIFVHKNLNYLNINLSKYCEDKDIEACALKLESTFFNICVITVYRAPCGILICFLLD
jgi:hypothetical protein